MRRTILSALLALFAVAALGHYAPPDSNLPQERGKTAVGVTYLFNIDYVHAGQSGVTGMAYIVLSPGSCGHPGYDKPTDFVPRAYLHYRWRHLGLFPLDGGGRWRTVPMFPHAEPDMLYTAGEIPVPDVPCDLEWYIVGTRSVPYYQHVDYTGRNLPVSSKLYTEEPEISYTSRMNYAGDDVLPSGGRDWFIRVRPYKSSVHAMRLSY